jgi:hypothetical protein
VLFRVSADDARKIGRIAHRRFEQELQHGHDIISNKPFKGIDAKPTFSARAPKPTVHQSPYLLSPAL